MQDLDTQQARDQNGDNHNLDMSNENINELQEGTSEENI